MDQQDTLNERVGRENAQLVIGLRILMFLHDDTAAAAATADDNELVILVN